MIAALALGMGWILATCYKYQPFNSVGALLTFRSGLLHVSYKEDAVQQGEALYKPEIHVDGSGVPHIYGKTDKDVSFGLGYMHARDRYFQMEMMTRTVQGTLSEFCGARTFSLDSFWRPYEFEKESKILLDEYKSAAPEFYSYLLAYSEGVNAFLNSNISFDPLYTIFGETPQPWKPEYSLMVTWYMSWSLSYFDHHIAQNELLTKLPADVFNYFYPLQPGGLIPILPSGKKTEVRLSKDLTGIPGVKKSSDNERISPFEFSEGIGSNNWALNPAKTKSGISILANDPHLYLTFPEAFYEAHMVSPGLNIYGFSIPGLPVIVSGHNDLAAWGITNGEWDLVDRYQLKVRNDSLYLYHNNWVPIEHKNYSIKVKGGSERLIRAENSIQGKVIREQDGLYYAQHWYAADKSYSAKAIYDLMQCRNWEEFKTALKGYGYPPQNFIYSDVEGNIGMVCAGNLPDRIAGYKGQLLDGTLEYKPVSTVDSQWYNYNPAKGYLFSANQQPIQNGFYFGAYQGEDDYRVRRINTLLQGKSDWNLQDIEKMQSDNVDLSYFMFEELITKFQVPANHKELVGKLADWAGDMQATSNQALLYEAFHWSAGMEAEKFANKYLKVERPPSLLNFLNYLNDDSYIVPDSPPKQELFLDILNKADSAIQRVIGPKWKTATYSDLSAISIENISFIPGFGEKVQDVGGNSNTINMNTHFFHPVFRAVYEMKKGNIKGYSIIAGGQSGKINSSHYTDQLSLWKNGKYKETQFSATPSGLRNITNLIIFR